MKRLVVIAAAVTILLAVLAPAAFAAESLPHADQVLVSVNGPVDVEEGHDLDLLVVIDGDAHISGDVRTIVLASGTATLSGATIETLVVLNGTADLQAGTTVLGDVRTLNGTVTQQPGSEVRGSATTLEGDLVALGVLLFGVLIVFVIGLGLAAIAATLLVAALAARQVRAVESLITRQPGQVLVAGIAGTVGLPLLSVLLMITVIGAPIGFAMLVILVPVAFLAWVVAAIWVGDWIVARMRGAREPERPYRAAVIGVIVLAVAGVLPFVIAIATLFGFGGLLLAAWRTFRHEAPPSGDAASIQPAPAAS